MKIKNPILFFLLGIIIVFISAMLLFRGGVAQAIVCMGGFAIGFLIIGLGAHGIKTNRGSRK